MIADRKPVYGPGSVAPGGMMRRRMLLSFGDDLQTPVPYAVAPAIPTGEAASVERVHPQPHTSMILHIDRHAFVVLALRSLLATVESIDDRCCAVLLSA